MSHYTVNFTGNAAAVHKQAIAECKRWMGAKRFKEFMENLRALTAKDSSTTRLRRIYFYAGLTGMQGRSVVHALYRESVK